MVPLASHSAFAILMRIEAGTNCILHLYAIFVRSLAGIDENLDGCRVHAIVMGKVNKRVSNEAVWNSVKHTLWKDGVSWMRCACKSCPRTYPIPRNPATWSAPSAWKLVAYLPKTRTVVAYCSEHAQVLTFGEESTLEQVDPSHSEIRVAAESPTEPQSLRAFLAAGLAR